MELVEPAPGDAALRQILAVAATVPDHGALQPYRFAVVRKAGREVFGEALVDAMAHARPDLPSEVFAKVKGKAFKAPMLVALVASPIAGKIDRWEQIATASCTGYAVVLAAQALGFGAVWKSSPKMIGPRMAELLGLVDGEELLGWVLLGTASDAPVAPRRGLDWDTKVRVIG